MEKTIYFFVNARIGHEIQYEKLRRFRSPSKRIIRTNLNVSHVFKVEQKASETEDIFYENLVELLGNSLKILVEPWKAEQDNLLKPKDITYRIFTTTTYEITNISRIS